MRSWLKPRLETSFWLAKQAFKPNGAWLSHSCFHFVLIVDALETTDLVLDSRLKVEWRSSSQPVVFAWKFPNPWWLSPGSQQLWQIRLTISSLWKPSFVAPPVNGFWTVRAPFLLLDNTPQHTLVGLVVLELHSLVPLSHLCPSWHLD
jgi:hypothetical protein